MPRLPATVEDAVIYLYPSKPAAEEGKPSGGTGFLVGVPSASLPNYNHVYAVTNRHVARPKTGNPSPVIRINTRSGGFEVIELNKHRWSPHPDGDDIAVCPIDLSPHYAYKVIETEMFLTRELAWKLNIGLGDDVYMVGRFLNCEGKACNLPTARYGIIANMPSEPVEHPDGHKQESYLVEMKSISGYSGSPVFVYGDAKRFPDTGIEGDMLNWFLGIDWGHLSGSYEPVYKKTVNEKGKVIYSECKDYYTCANANIAKVIPAWRLLEFLYLRDFRMQRQKKDEQIIEHYENHPVKLD